MSQPPTPYRYDAASAATRRLFGLEDDHSNRVCHVQSCQKPLTHREVVNGFCGACGCYVPHK